MSRERERTRIEEVEESADNATTERRIGLQPRHCCGAKRGTVRMIRETAPPSQSYIYMRLVARLVLAAVWFGNPLENILTLFGVSVAKPGLFG